MVHGSLNAPAALSANGGLSKQASNHGCHAWTERLFWQIRTPHAQALDLNAALFLLMQVMHFDLRLPHSRCRQRLLVCHANPSLATEVRRGLRAGRGERRFVELAATAALSGLVKLISAGSLVVGDDDAALPSNSWCF